MKRKLLTTLLSAVMSASFAIGFTACGDGEEAHAHTYGEWKTTVASTCAAAGKMERECTCGDKQEEAVAALGHDLKHYDAKAATCQAAGWKAYDECLRCDYTTYEETAKTQHDFKERLCTVCNAIDPAAPVTQGLEFALNEDGESYSLVGAGTAENISILNVPAVYDGKPVTAVADGAFTENESLIMVLLPDGITEIGEWAFSEAFDIKAVRLPQSLTEIGDGAFLRIGGTESLTIPDGVTSVGNWAFYSCRYIEKVYIPASVKKIGEGAFCGRALKEIILEEGIENYVSEGGVLFNKDKTLLLCYPAGKTQATYVIPESVTAIGSCAFSYCPFTGIEIPDGISVIEEATFDSSENLTEIIIPARESISDLHPVF